MGSSLEFHPTFRTDRKSEAARVARLKVLLKRASELLRQSDTFPDAEKLLAALDERGLEGIVSKRTDQS